MSILVMAEKIIFENVKWKFEINELLRSIVRRKIFLSCDTYGYDRQNIYCSKVWNLNLNDVVNTEYS